MTLASRRRAVVTGGAGFIGSHLCRSLVEDGFEVVAVDNLITGSLVNIEDLRSSHLFTFVQDDVRYGISVEGDVSHVFHLASPASPAAYHAHPIHTLEVGSQGTSNALDLAVRTNATFLLASTSEVYGDPLVHPQPESYLGNVSSIGPRSVYDESKRYAEALTMAYHREYELPTRIARIFNTYGPGMALADGRALPNFITQALAGLSLTLYGDGSHTRSFCYVDDTVRGLRALIEQSDPYPVNIGNPIERTMFDVAQAVVHYSGSNSSIVYRMLPEDDPKLQRPDITRAQHLLQWAPKVEFDDGLRQTIEWFAAQMNVSVPV